MFPSFVFSFVSKISVYIFHFSIFPKTTYSFFLIFWVSPWILFEDVTGISQNNLFYLFCFRVLSSVLFRKFQSIFFIFLFFPKQLILFFLIFWVSPWILFENVTGISQNNLFYLFCFRVLSSVLFRKFQSIFFIFLFFPKQLILFFWFFEFRLESCLKTSQVFPKIIYSIFFVSEFCLQFCFENFSLYFSFFPKTTYSFFLIFLVSPWILFENVTGISQNNLFYLFCFRVLSSVLFRKFQSIFFIFLFFPKQLILFFWFFEFRLESCLKTSQVFPKIIYSIFFVSEFCLQFCFENFSPYFSFFYFSQNNLFFFFFFDFLSFALNLVWKRHRYFPK